MTKKLSILLIFLVAFLIASALGIIEVNLKAEKIIHRGLTDKSEIFKKEHVKLNSQRKDTCILSDDLSSQGNESHVYN